MATRRGLNGEYRDGLGESGGILNFKATNWLEDNAALTVSGSLWSPIFVFIFHSICSLFAPCIPSVPSAPMQPFL